MRFAHLVPFVIPTGCTGLDAAMPTLEFDTVEVRSIDFDGVSLDLVFDMQTQQSVSVPLNGWSWDLAIEGIPALSGDSSFDEAGTFADGSKLRIPVELDYAALASTLAATQGKDTLAFELEGTFDLDTPIGVIPIPVSQVGEIPALRAPKFALQSVKLDNVDLWGADLAIDLSVNNLGASPITFEQFNYAVELSGHDVVSGALLGASVDGQSTNIVSVPVRVGFLQTSIALVDALITGEPVTVGMQTSLQVGTPFGIVPLEADLQDVLAAF
jgi:LEA14-like dessication related protein